jgi:hypothetical protein
VPSKEYKPFYFNHNQYESPIIDNLDWVTDSPAKPKHMEGNSPLNPLVFSVVATCLVGHVSKQLL